MVAARETCREAVRAYLERTGGAELDGIWNGLRRVWTLADVRRAVKDLGAEGRKFGQWDRDPAQSYWNGDGPTSTERFTMYSLRPWRTVGGSIGVALEFCKLVSTLE